MKAKLSLLIPLLTIVGLVACTAAIPVSSTSTTVATSSTTTSSAITSTVAPTVEDFTFFAGASTEDSPVFDAKNFTEATISYKCGYGNARFLKINTSPDGLNWIQQYDFSADACQFGGTVTLKLSGRYIKGNIAGTDIPVQMFGRFSN